MARARNMAITVDASPSGARPQTDEHVYGADDDAPTSIYPGLAIFLLVRLRRSLGS